ncbi:MAG: energy transducer TonB [Heliobacteriaceae bacterium]|jgi:hypothetical protein|nr:energy transducer TonB [Heliobacteriaceae bacterium]
MFKKVLILLAAAIFFAASAYADTYKSLSSYKAYAQKTFSKNLDFVIKQQKEFSVIFIINKDGLLKNIRMLKSAGSSLDAEITEALGNTELDPIPSEFNKKEIYYKFGFSPNTKSREILSYERTAQNIAMQNIPVARSRRSREIWFNLTVDCDGIVQNVEILGSSGSGKYDNEVTKAMKSLNFPQFYENMKVDTIEIPIRADKHQ